MQDGSLKSEHRFHSEQKREVLKELVSMESLDRASPDLWPEKIPGISDYTNTEQENGEPKKNPTQGLDEEMDEQDYNLLVEYSSLSPASLVREYQRLQNVAYELGLEEAKEMTRGKYLNVLQKKRRK
ncbi:protein lin-52 homolog [Artemia franciscana]|uniref:Protein lin-52 homolog n=1 Tax=Artemia franciscana TaxID=6661 RepID=A0AA88HB36_ARTSF|nr:hypothetical protein QYM36_014911 [Artemia franciscana]